MGKKEKGEREGIIKKTGKNRRKEREGTRQGDEKAHSKSEEGEVREQSKETLTTRRNENDLHDGTCAVREVR